MFSLVLRSGFNTAIYILGINKQAICTNPPRLRAKLRVTTLMWLLALKKKSGTNANQITKVV